MFFHEILGHRVEGHRQKREDEGQTFKKMVNQKVLPETFSVIFDPTVRRRGEMDLVGAYRYDNEGVKARRVPVIEKGVLKNFLMSRTPVEGFSRSNGHGRKQSGLAAVARQSNLFVEVTRSHSREELKAMLIDSLKREDKPFGLYFKDVQGGFTMTGRVRPNVLQRAANYGVPDLRRRARGAGPRGGPHRYAADSIQQDHGRGRSHRVL